jgi:hypothetical protein
MEHADHRQSTAIGLAHAPSTAITPAPTLSRGLICLLAIACAVGVGNVYLAQAVTPLIASGLHSRRARRHSS